jgi:GNAT superfamily N-acetyltransferase
MSAAAESGMVVRPVIAADIKRILELDRTTTTDYIWQMDLREEDSQTRVTFQPTRLPRSIKIASPYDINLLAVDWKQRALVIVGEVAGRLLGYLTLTHGTTPQVGVIVDFVVDRPARRRGVGTVLLGAARDWATRAGLQRLIIETQSKNFPAICFCQRNGFAYCGYNDRYYASQDIALFFGMKLR